MVLTPWPPAPEARENRQVVNEAEIEVAPGTTAAVELVEMHSPDVTFDVESVDRRAGR